MIGRSLWNREAYSNNVVLVGFDQFESVLVEIDQDRASRCSLLRRQRRYTAGIADGDYEKIVPFLPKHDNC